MHRPTPQADSDSAQELFAQLISEPFRTKVVERLELPNRATRWENLKRAHFSPVHLKSEEVCIDLITDSGTGAMSDAQWAGLMRGDEAYMHSRNFGSFEGAVQEATGYKEVIPTHQGRAAENIIMELLVKPGDIVLSNTLFDTTRAHVENREAVPVDVISDSLWDFPTSIPFKGNFDLEKLEAALMRHGDRVSMIVATVLNNFACSSPVSLENLRAVRALADRFKKPLFLDACRFAENAYFIKQWEAEFAHHSISEIAREVFALADGCWMSAKKDAIVNIGGFLATDDHSLAQRFRERLVLYEGFYTYGGLASRDLEAIAVGLREAVDERYLRHRTDQVAYLGQKLEDVGAVVSRPFGGSGVFIDVAAAYPHLPPDKFPGVALCADFYLEGGIRLGAAPFPMRCVDPATGELVDRTFQFARFALPRRVYSKSHLDFVAAIAQRVLRNAQQSLGYQLVESSGVLGHFFAKFQPL